MKIEWKKCPSVTRGGKPFFWVTINVKETYWVVWDRFFQKWTVQSEPKTGEESPFWGWFFSSNEAMSFVERILNEETNAR